MEPTAQSTLALIPFGKYLLDEEIARGGMARVYLARLRGLGGFEKKLVVKQVLPELARDPRFVEMFVEEAKTLVQMSHPHIVPVYELGVVDGVYFLAMEHVDGATLAEILHDGAIEATLVAHVGAQVCDALQYAHQRHGLIHRDVTPRNVIVDSLGHTRLLDFGIAAKVEGMETGDIFGSHGYMSPEQAQGEAVDARSDIFSLGCVLYESLTNEAVFLRSETEQTRAALLDGDVPRLVGRGDVPDGLADLIDEMLERDVSSRPESAGRVGQRLRGWLARAAPEGIAPELGTRADLAASKRHLTPSRRPPSLAGPTKARGQTQSIATNVSFKEILEKHDSSHPPALDPGLIEDIALQDTAKLERLNKPVPQGTVPIEGRRSTAPEASEGADLQGGTVAIEGRRRALGGEPKATIPREATAPGEPSPLSRYLPIVAALAVAVIGGFAVQAAMNEPNPEPVEGPVSDNPREDHPEQTQLGDPEQTQLGDPEQTQLGDPEQTQLADPEQTQLGDPEQTQVGDPEQVTPPTNNPPQARGTLSVGVSGNGEVKVDGRVRGQGTLRNLSLPPGQHTVEVTNTATGETVRATVEVVNGDRVTVRANMMGSPPTISVSAARAP